MGMVCLRKRICMGKGGSFGFWIHILFVPIPECIERYYFLRDGTNERERDVELGEESYRILM